MSTLTLDEVSANAICQKLKYGEKFTLSSDGTDLLVKTAIKTIAFRPSLASQTQIRMEAQGFINRPLVAAGAFLAESSFPSWLTRDGATLCIHVDRFPVPDLELHSIRVGAIPAEMLSVSFSFL